MKNIVQGQKLQKRKYLLEGLDCANCAAKTEKTLKEQENMGYVELNFAAKSIFLEEEHVPKAQKIIDNIEPGVKLVPAKRFENEHEEDMNIKKQLAVMGVSFLLLLAGLIYRKQLYNTPFAIAEYAVFLISYFLVGWNILISALKNITRGNVFDENFLMTIATIGAIAVHELPEAVAVMLFFYVGEFFQKLAVNRTRKSIKALLNIKPEYANLKINGDVKKVSPESVNVGDIIIVKPGEKVPLDGVVIEGSSFLDTSALTGESIPSKVEKGEEVLAGMINTNGLLTVEVTKTFEDSSVAKILDLVENAAGKKAPTEKFITKFSRYYTPAVVIGALALAAIPPIVIPGAAFSDWLYRALILLVISCPCALVVSIPLGYFGGIGAASKKGILVKGANFLDALTDLKTVVFDKTGTLTKGVFKVSEVQPQNGFSENELLKYAAIAEVNSNHPIAKSIIEAYKGDIPNNQIEEYEEISGHGIRAKYDGKIVLAGNDRLLRKENIPYNECDVEGTVVYVAVDGKFAGYIVISDEIKEDSAKAVARLKKYGIKTIILTGDDTSVAESVASRLGIDEVFSRLLPQDKVSIIEKLMENLAPNEKLAFVGDGINDAPVITRADIGVAMGGLGSDAAIEAADVVIMDDMPSKMATAVNIANHTKQIIKQNITFALGVKGIFFIFGSMGMATMWEAVFADVGVALLAIYNSTRALRYKEKI
ncbi:MAG: Zn2+/Cd2+-exporting ATPase [Thermosediminibacterales bacterium]|nr:Zn2+/Cd2+-exporting ATPase [Thermosediminibacterales bacterium]MDK2835332.1 Zn2+/Cd2+-exporting ATPase [Thermosediminibacterales bacterium]